MTQLTPRWVGYGRSAEIHFLPGVGASLPPTEMLEGKAGEYSGSRMGGGQFGRPADFIVWHDVGTLLRIACV